MDNLVAQVRDLLDNIQQNLYDVAKQKKEACIQTVSTWEEFVQALGQKKLILAPWCDEEVWLLWLSIFQFFCYFSFVDSFWDLTYQMNFCMSVDPPILLVSYTFFSRPCSHYLFAQKLLIAFPFFAALLFFLALGGGEGCESSDKG